MAKRRDHRASIPPESDGSSLSWTLAPTRRRFQVSPPVVQFSLSDLGVGRRLEDNIRDGRDIVTVLRVGGESLPRRVLAKLAPRRVARRNVGEGEHVGQA